MSYALESVCNRIDAFSRIFKEYGFYEHGVGIKPWSHRFVNVVGARVDVNATSWTFYGKDGITTATNVHPESLKAFLQGFEEIA